MAVYIAMAIALCIIMFIAGYSMGYRDCADHIKAELDEILDGAEQEDKKEDQT